MQTEITIDNLRVDGWQIFEKENLPGLFPYLAEKKIENRNPLNDSSDSDIKLILHRLYYPQSFAIALPDGGMLNFVANTMDQLQAFEKAINFYDPLF